MLGRDVNSSPTQYRTWVVDGQPDFTGQHYTGHKSGPEPFVDVSAYTIFDPNAVVDFNLPNALDWQTSLRTMPSGPYDSHTAIIGNFVYLFGGKGDANIYRATLDNPADWQATGSFLPTVLSGAQLAIIGDKIYLFGGNNGEAADTIYSASVNDPLTWTNNGSRLPRKLYDSQLGIVDGYLYLFGGYEINNASNVIFKASVADPLTWVDTGARLPDPLYGSQLAIVNGYMYLFGGLFFPDTPTSKIYIASLSDPLTWGTSYYSLPYSTCYAQFFTIGTEGYLVGATTSSQYFTPILRCHLNDPQKWVDSHRQIPGVVSQSQVAIIYDRIWLFGGNGSTVIFANNSQLKYKLGSAAVVNYGTITRTLYKNTPNKLDLFKVIGFPPWKTDYGA